MKLYNIPRGSKLRITMEDGTTKLCTFHHLDGAYSYCTIDEYEEKKPESGRFHLHASTPLILKDDAYEIEPSV